jgi:outer membrane biosynthesis protein TonB
MTPHGHLYVVAVVLGCASRGPAVEPARRAAPPSPTRGAELDTGFDLIISPADAIITRWSLDGKPQPGPPPARIRGLSPGRHVIKIDSPSFDTAERDVFVEEGQTTTVVITAAPPATGAPAGPAPATCAEVACSASNHDGACCPYERPKDRRPGAGPGSLDSAMVKSSLALIRPAIIACSSGTSSAGVVRLAVTVAPEGRVDTVTIKESPDATLAACVAGVMRTAKFPKTERGGTFIIPFSF